MTGLTDARTAGRVSDADLVREYRRDPDRFTDVYDRYFGDVHRYVAGRLDTQAADDIAAETFLVAFRKRERFDPARGALRPWLFGIATKLVAQHRRVESRHYETLTRVRAAPDDHGHENQVVTAVAAAGLQPQLARALAALTRKERDVLLLVALADLSHEEVAQALGIPYGTVGSRLNRARKKLRTALEKEIDVNG
ncbi:RNA polymerase sigma factor [Actinoallomurus rhizosphaericola]|uniref:RNA polymerase sigma factor n=1 Tax=Actinoallomurus rhizosphaericola TaxID=2952536 RepID=UPI002092747E|nr:RNA polymerase sigma factor [Actinoallomurus rhizosphaericola]MCO5996176.1 RNA polymerase sigma factor [Actinoallomurus rhizosphaericola]